MEDVVKEFSSLLREIKCSGTSMKNSIEELSVPDGEYSECACNHDNCALEKEITSLKSQCHALESMVGDKCQLQKELNDDTEHLKARLNDLETLVQEKINAYLTSSSSNGNSNTKRTIDIASQREHVINAEAERQTQKQSRPFLPDIEADDSLQKNTNITSKPNFIKEEASLHISQDSEKSYSQLSVAFIKQEVKRVYGAYMHWRGIAKKEQRRNRELYKNLEDIHVVICVDISESMADVNGWTNAHTFLTDYIRGLEDMSKFHDFTPEHVSVVIFGHETKVLVEYTDRYKEILNKLDAIRLGGPTQMFGGILLADAMAFSTNSHVERLSNGAFILTRIIMITDGRVTEADLVAGPDTVDVYKDDETKANILQKMEDFRRTQRDVFFVPVGNLDLDFINTMAACSGGMLLNYTYGKRFAKRQLLTDPMILSANDYGRFEACLEKQLVDPVGMMTDAFTHDSDHYLSEEDKEDMRNIQERARRYIVVTDVDSRNKYEEIQSSQLPEVGCRVRRGPDWEYMNQDSYGPGTVIGHDDETHVWCEWDLNGYNNIYHYGSRGYSVLVIDEPRKLIPGEIMAVGCQVIPGKDWKNSDVNADTGVVIKIDKENNSVLVRWNNGKRGDYSYAGDGKQEEVKVKPTVEAASVKDPREISSQAMNWKYLQLCR